MFYDCDEKGLEINVYGNVVHSEPSEIAACANCFYTPAAALVASQLEENTFCKTACLQTLPVLAEE